MARPKMPAPMLRNFRVRELTRLFESRYRGLPLPDDDDGWGDIEDMLMASSIGLTGDIAVHLEIVAHRWASHFDQTKVARLVDKISNMPQRYRRRTAEKLGKAQFLRWEERERLGIRTIRAFDKTAGEIRAIRLERGRERDLIRRRARGIQPRAAYLAQFAHSARKLKPWERLGISRPTFYRMKARGEYPNQQRPGLSETGCLPISKGSEYPNEQRPGLTLPERG